MWSKPRTPAELTKGEKAFIEKLKSDGEDPEHIAEFQRTILSGKVNKKRHSLMHYMGLPQDMRRIFDDVSMAGYDYMNPKKLTDDEKSYILAHTKDGEEYKRMKSDFKHNDRRRFRDLTEEENLFLKKEVEALKASGMSKKELYDYEDNRRWDMQQTKAPVLAGGDVADFSEFDVIQNRRDKEAAEAAAAEVQRKKDLEKYWADHQKQVAAERAAMKRQMLQDKVKESKPVKILQAPFKKASKEIKLHKLEKQEKKKEAEQYATEKARWEEGREIRQQNRRTMEQRWKESDEIHRTLDDPDMRDRQVRKDESEETKRSRRRFLDEMDPATYEDFLNKGKTVEPEPEPDYSDFPQAVVYDSIADAMAGKRSETPLQEPPKTKIKRTKQSKGTLPVPPPPKGYTGGSASWDLEARMFGQQYRSLRQQSTMAYNDGRDSEANAKHDEAKALERQFRRQHGISKQDTDFENWLQSGTSQSQATVGHRLKGGIKNVFSKKKDTQLPPEHKPLLPDNIEFEDISNADTSSEGDIDSGPDRVPIKRKNRFTEKILKPIQRKGQDIKRGAQQVGGALGDMGQAAKVAGKGLGIAGQVIAPVAKLGAKAAVQGAKFVGRQISGSEAPPPKKEKPAKIPKAPTEYGLLGGSGKPPKLPPKKDEDLFTPPDDQPPIQLAQPPKEPQDTEQENLFTNPAEEEPELPPPPKRKPLGFAANAEDLAADIERLKKTEDLPQIPDKKGPNKPYIRSAELDKKITQYRAEADEDLDRLLDNFQKRSAPQEPQQEQGSGWLGSLINPFKRGLSSLWGSGSTPNPEQQEEEPLFTPEKIQNLLNDTSSSESYSEGPPRRRRHRRRHVIPDEEQQPIVPDEEQQPDFVGGRTRNLQQFSDEDSDGGDLDSDVDDRDPRDITLNDLPPVRSTEELRNTSEPLSLKDMSDPDSDSYFEAKKMDLDDGETDETHESDPFSLFTNPVQNVSRQPVSKLSQQRIKDLEKTVDAKTGRPGNPAATITIPDSRSGTNLRGHVAYAEREMHPPERPGTVHEVYKDPETGQVMVTYRDDLHDIKRVVSERQKRADADREKEDEYFEDTSVPAREYAEEKPLQIKNNEETQDSYRQNDPQLIPRGQMHSSVMDSDISEAELADARIRDDIQYRISKSAMKQGKKSIPPPGPIPPDDLFVPPTPPPSLAPASVPPEQQTKPESNDEKPYMPPKAAQAAQGLQIHLRDITASADPSKITGRRRHSKFNPPMPSKYKGGQQDWNNQIQQFLNTERHQRRQALDAEKAGDYKLASQLRDEASDARDNFAERVGMSKSELKEFLDKKSGVARPSLWKRGVLAARNLFNFDSDEPSDDAENLSTSGPINTQNMSIAQLQDKMLEFPDDTRYSEALERKIAEEEAKVKPTATWKIKKQDLFTDPNAEDEELKRLESEIYAHPENYFKGLGKDYNRRRAQLQGPIKHGDDVYQESLRRLITKGEPYQLENFLDNTPDYVEPYRLVLNAYRKNRKYSEQYQQYKNRGGLNPRREQPSLGSLDIEDTEEPPNQHIYKEESGTAPTSDDQSMMDKSTPKTYQEESGTAPTSTSRSMDESSPPEKQPIPQGQDERRERLANMSTDDLELALGGAMYEDDEERDEWAEELAKRQNLSKTQVLNEYPSEGEVPVSQSLEDDMSSWSPEAFISNLDDFMRNDPDSRDIAIAHFRQMYPEEFNQWKMDYGYQDDDDDEPEQEEPNAPVEQEEQPQQTDDEKFMADWERKNPLRAQMSLEDLERGNTSFKKHVQNAFPDPDLERYIQLKKEKNEPKPFAIADQWKMMDERYPGLAQMPLKDLKKHLLHYSQLNSPSAMEDVLEKYVQRREAEENEPPIDQTQPDREEAEVPNVPSAIPATAEEEASLRESFRKRQNQEDDLFVPPPPQDPETILQRNAERAANRWAQDKRGVKKGRAPRGVKPPVKRDPFLRNRPTADQQIPPTSSKFRKHMEENYPQFKNSSATELADFINWNKQNHPDNPNIQAAEYWYRTNQIEKQEQSVRAARAKANYNPPEQPEPTYSEPEELADLDDTPDVSPDVSTEDDLFTPPQTTIPRAHSSSRFNKFKNIFKRTPKPGIEPGEELADLDQDDDVKDYEFPEEQELADLDDNASGKKKDEYQDVDDYSFPEKSDDGYNDMSEDDFVNQIDRDEGLYSTGTKKKSPDADLFTNPEPEFESVPDSNALGLASKDFSPQKRRFSFPSFKNPFKRPAKPQKVKPMQLDDLDEQEENSFYNDPDLENMSQKNSDPEYRARLLREGSTGNPALREDWTPEDYKSFEVFNPEHPNLRTIQTEWNKIENPDPDEEIELDDLEEKTDDGNDRLEDPEYRERLLREGEGGRVYRKNWNALDYNAFMSLYPDHPRYRMMESENVLLNDHRNEPEPQMAVDKDIDTLYRVGLLSPEARLGLLSKDDYWNFRHLLPTHPNLRQVMDEHGWNWEGDPDNPSIERDKEPKLQEADRFFDSETPEQPEPELNPEPVPAQRSQRDLETLEGEREWGIYENWDQNDFGRYLDAHPDDEMIWGQFEDRFPDDVPLYLGTPRPRPKFSSASPDVSPEGEQPTFETMTNALSDKLGLTDEEIAGMTEEEIQEAYNEIQQEEPRVQSPPPAPQNPSIPNEDFPVSNPKPSGVPSTPFATPNPFNGPDMNTPLSLFNHPAGFNLRGPVPNRQGQEQPSFQSLAQPQNPPNGGQLPFQPQAQQFGGMQAGVNPQLPPPLPPQAQQPVQPPQNPPAVGGMQIAAPGGQFPPLPPPPQGGPGGPPPGGGGFPPNGGPGGPPPGGGGFPPNGGPGGPPPGGGGFPPNGGPGGPPPGGGGFPPNGGPGGPPPPPPGPPGPLGPNYMGQPLNPPPPPPIPAGPPPPLNRRGNGPYTYMMWLDRATGAEPEYAQVAEAFKKFYKSDFDNWKKGFYIPHDKNVVPRTRRGDYIEIPHPLDYGVTPGYASRVEGMSPDELVEEAYNSIGVIPKRALDYLTDLLSHKKQQPTRKDWLEDRTDGQVSRAHLQYHDSTGALMRGADAHRIANTPMKELEDQIRSGYYDPPQPPNPVTGFPGTKGGKYGTHEKARDYALDVLAYQKERAATLANYNVSPEKDNWYEEHINPVEDIPMVEPSRTQHVGPVHGPLLPAPDVPELNQWAGTKYGESPFKTYAERGYKGDNIGWKRESVFTPNKSGRPLYEDRYDRGPNHINPAEIAPPMQKSVRPSGNLVSKRIEEMARRDNENNYNLPPYQANGHFVNNPKYKMSKSAVKWISTADERDHDEDGELFTDPNRFR